MCIRDRDLSNPLGYITTDATTATELLAVDNILSNYACTYEVYDEDGVPTDVPLDLNFLVEDDISYSPSIISYSGTCTPCEVLANHIDEGHWAPIWDDNGSTLLSADWIPGSWDISGLEALVGEQLSPMQIMQAINQCLSSNPELFPVMNGGYYNFPDGQIAAALLPNFLGCNSQVLADGTIAGINGVAIPEYYQDTESCLCETVGNYVSYDSDLEEYVLDYNTFNTDYGLNMSEEEFRHFIKHLDLSLIHI